MISRRLNLVLFVAFLVVGLLTQPAAAQQDVDHLRRINYMASQGVTELHDMLEFAVNNAADMLNVATMDAAIDTERNRVKASDLTRNLRVMRGRWTDQEISDEWALEKVRPRP